MPLPLSRTLAPALAGHAFQQTALVGMLPLVAREFGLPVGQIAVAVAGGMAAAAVALPLLGARTGPALLRCALLGLLLSSAALMAMLAAGPLDGAAMWVFPALIALRAIQGVSAATVLLAAQQTSAEEDRPLGALARVHSFAGLGRALGALMLGPLLWIGEVVPLLPAAAGALASLVRTRPAMPQRRPAHPLAPPRWRAVWTPALVQVAVGAAQIGLAPLMASRLALGAEAASGLAGICLAAANAGLLAMHRWITPGASVRTARLAAFALPAAALALALCAHPAAFVAFSAVIGGSSALLLAVNLSGAMAAQPGMRGQAAGWNGAIQLGGLAAGVALGSLLMALSPAAPLLACALVSLPLAFAPTLRNRSTT